MMKRLLLCCFLIFQIYGSNQGLDQVRKELSTIDQNLNTIRIELLDLSQLSIQKLETFQIGLKEASRNLNQIRIGAEKDLLSVQAMLDDLGPAPEPGDFPEDAEMAEQRAQLKERVIFFHNRVARSKALIARSTSLLADVNQARLKLQVYTLKKRSSPLYELQGSEEGFSKVFDLFHLGNAEFKKDIFTKIVSKKGLIIGCLFLAVIIGLFFVRRPLKARYLIQNGDVSDIYKMKEALVDFIADGFIPLSIVFLLLFYIKIISLFPDSLYMFTFSLFLLLGGLWAYLVLLRVLFRPNMPSHRFIHIEEGLIHSLWKRLSWVGPLLALTIWFQEIDLKIDLPEDFADYVRFGLQTALCVNLLFLLDPKIYGFLRKFSKFASTLFRYVAGLILIAAPILLFVGYLALAEYLLFGLLQSAALIALLLIGFILTKAAIDSLISQSSILFKKYSVKQRSITLLQYWLVGFFGFCFWLGAILGFLYIWGIGSSYVSLFLNKLYYGFEVSGQRVSLALIASAVIAFALSLTMIKACIHFLDKHVFPYTTMQRGLAEALKTMIRYVLIVIAFILCVRILGFKLTSLAYVAGGLSVGVGLGLQPIIMNFISGVIMLIERPVRVGDTLEVNGEWGTVTKISVRATCIRTFQHAMLMVPNSELITNTVKNWTRENTIRRLEVQVGVAYGSDAEKVSQILLEIAKELEYALVQPPPTVVFNAFGSSSLTFILKVCIADISQTLTAKTQVHKEIAKKFKENGIEIAFPQMDVHLKQEPTHV